MSISVYHVPVLLKESIESLHIRHGLDYADCTLGGGGHSEKIAENLEEGQCLHCFDRDIEAINAAKSRLARFGKKISYHCKPFSCLGEELAPKTLGGVLYDLGVSSHQIDSSRGFSFSGNEQLDMRMDASSGESAQEYLKRIPEKELTIKFRENSDLERANVLARRILSEISHGMEITSTNLSKIIEEVYSNRREDFNSLKARVFQAIRMEINSEISELKKSVEAAIHCLKSGGRLCVITYHSKETGALREMIRKFEKDCVCDSKLPVCVCGGNHKKIIRVSKKAIKPGEEEIKANSRSRSAALRVYERV